MKYGVEMDSGAMIYKPSFIKIGSGIPKLIGEIQTHRQHGDRICLLLFIQNKGSRKKRQFRSSFMFWNTALCSPLKVNGSIGGTCRFRLQSRRVNQERNHREAGSNRKATIVKTTDPR
jgi:hypothetical protein